MNEILKKLDLIYEHRLLEATTGESNNITRAEVEILLDYIKDLREQNLTLVETVVELEREALSRVAAAEKLLEQTASAKECMIQLQQYNKLVTDQFKNYYRATKQVQEWQEKCSAIEEHNSNLLHDINSLLQLITHARNTGRWDVGNLEFCDVTFEQVFGSAERLSTSSAGEWSNHDECNWRKQNSDAGELYGDSCLLSSNSYASLPNQRSPNAGSVPYHCDALVTKLQLQLKQSQQHTLDLQNQVLDKDRVIVDLQRQLATLQHDAAVQGSECFSHMETLRELHQQSRKDGMEISRLTEQNKQLLLNFLGNEEKCGTLRVAGEETHKCSCELLHVEKSHSSERINGGHDDADLETENELNLLRNLEARHRLKAEGLEVVIHQLNQQLKDLEKQRISTSHDEMISQLKQRLNDEERKSAFQASELENQMVTIGNLQQALISAKNGQSPPIPVKKISNASSEIFDV